MRFNEWGERVGYDEFHRRTVRHFDGWGNFLGETGAASAFGHGRPW